LIVVYASIEFAQRGKVIGSVAIGANVRPREDSQEKRAIADNRAQQSLPLLHRLRERQQVVILLAAHARVPRHQQRLGGHFVFDREQQLGAGDWVVGVLRSLACDCGRAAAFRRREAIPPGLEVACRSAAVEQPAPHRSKLCRIAQRRTGLGEKTLALLLLPYVDAHPRGVGVWFARERRVANGVFAVIALVVVAVTIVGTFFRGPNWAWVWPW